MSDRTELAHLVESLSTATVLVVGDIMLDHFITGDIDRISPEAPVPILRITGETTMLGGAGNVVSNIIALGAKAHVVGCIGDDDAGKNITRRLDENPQITSHLFVNNDIETTTKSRYLSANQQILRTDRESSSFYTPQAQQAILETTSSALSHCDIVIVSDYGKGVLCNGLARKVIAMANEQNIPVIVDPKGTDYSIYAGATLVTPNRRELSAATGSSTQTNEEIISVSKQLMRSHNIGGVLATRSADGMTLVEPDSVIHLRAEAQEVYDVSGAGDTVIAAMATALAAGLDRGQALALANVAAGIAVSKVGTATVYASDVTAALFHQDISGAEIKITTPKQALERIERWKRHGHSVGFTNGCFDLLHPGHISLLKQSRKACDRLIVGLNSDSSVKRLKGDSRPIQTEMSRATVLASLETVDLVVIFDENTPLALITELLPDVLVKGADYTIDTVVGADVVQRNGGRIVLAKLVDGQSTTGTLSRISETK